MHPLARYSLRLKNTASIMLRPDILIFLFRNEDGRSHRIWRGARPLFLLPQMDGHCVWNPQHYVNAKSHIHQFRKLLHCRSVSSLRWTCLHVQYTPHHNLCCVASESLCGALCNSIKGYNLHKIIIYLDPRIYSKFDINRLLRQ